MQVPSSPSPSGSCLRSSSRARRRVGTPLPLPCSPAANTEQRTRHPRNDCRQLHLDYDTRHLPSATCARLVRVLHLARLSPRPRQRHQPDCRTLALVLDAPPLPPPPRARSPTIYPTTPTTHTPTVPSASHSHNHTSARLRILLPAKHAPSCTRHGSHLTPTSSSFVHQSSRTTVHAPSG